MQALLEAGAAWDGSAYERYPDGAPEIRVLRMRIPAETTLPWHSHQRICTGYVLEGEFVIEKRDGTSARFRAGDAVSETVGAVHRGRTGAEGVTLIVFVAGSAGVSMSDVEREGEDGCC